MRMRESELLDRGGIWFFVIMAVVVMVMIVALPQIDAEGESEDPPVYGSDTSPYGGLYSKWVDLDDGGTYYLAKDSPVIILFDGQDLSTLSEQLERTGIGIVQEENSLKGNLSVSTTITFEGKTITLATVSGIYYGELPIFGAITQEKDFSGGDYPDAKYRTYYSESVVVKTESTSWGGTPGIPDFTTTLNGESLSVYGLSINFEWVKIGSSYSFELVATLTGTPIKTITNGELISSYTTSGIGATIYNYTSHLTIKGFIITYDDGGQYGQTSRTTDEWSEGVMLKLPTVTVTDPTKQFDGWYTAKSGGNFAGIGGATVPNADVVFERDTTLYARYSATPNPVADIQLTGEYSVKVGLQTMITAKTIMTNENEVPAEQRYVVFELISGSEFVGYNTIDFVDGGRITVIGLKVGEAEFKVTAKGGQVSKTFKITVNDSSTVNQYSYTVNFDLDGGSPTIPPESFTSSSTTYLYTLPATDPSKEGYHFLGWSVGSVNPNDYLPSGEKISINYGPTTIFANWAANEYRFVLSFYNNAGTEKIMEDLNGTDDESSHPFTIHRDSPVVEGKVFLGWATSPNSSTVSYGPGGTYVARSPESKLYAVFEDEEVIVPFKIIFHPTFGSGGPTEATPEGDGNSITYEIPQSEPTRTGWQFLGWSKYIDGDPMYKRNGENGLQGSLTLYRGTTELFAIWKSIEMTLEFNPNGGTGSMETLIASSDNNYYVTIPLSTTFTKAGFVCDGWADSADADEVQYSFGQRIQLTASKVIYAVWVPVSESNKYTLTFVSDITAKNMPSDITNEDGNKTFTIPRVKPESEGMVFIGWTLVQGGTVPTHYMGDSFTATGPTSKLYAVWQKGTGTWTVTFDPNGGTGEPKPLSMVVTGESWTFTIPDVKPPILSGYTFMGWSENPDITDKMNLPRMGSQYTSYKDDLTLYAIWEKGTVALLTITFDANGGTGNVPSEMTVDGIGKLNVTIPAEPIPTAPEGYVFKGWCENSAGIGEIRKAGMSTSFTIEKSTPVLLYAIYEPIGSGIDFILQYLNPDESVIATKTVSSNTGSAAFVLLKDGEFNTPAGKIFKYWSKTKNGPEVKTTDGIYTTIAKESVLYAVYESTDPNDPKIDWEITMNGLTVRFDASKCQNYTSLKWVLPDGTSSGQTVFDYTFGASGDYYIKLVMIGNDGQEYVKEDNIHVGSISKEYMLIGVILIGVIMALVVLRVKGVF